MKMECTIGIFLLMFFLGNIQAVPKERTTHSHFAGDEHQLIGDTITIKLEGINSTLTLPNGIQLTFGQIIALAGDYFAGDEPIISVKKSERKKSEDRKRKLESTARERFVEAYATLALTPREKIEKLVSRLAKMIEEDKEVRKHEDEDNGNFHGNMEWTLASRGKMLSLAAKNFDHFQPQAEEVYLVGHRLAIETAQKGAEKTGAEKKKKLMEALCIDAFACHFLTDCFSAGHIRTPRVELHYQVFASKIGDLLSKYMHDEDCKFGLRVQNKRGDKWRAYGDNYLLRNGSATNLRLVLEAVQTSVDQVLKSYQDADAKIDENAVRKLIPFVDPEAKNNTPLFLVRGDKLHVREILSDLQSNKTSSSWTGAGRLAKLATSLSYEPKKSALPSADETE